MATPPLSRLGEKEDRARLLGSLLADHRPRLLDQARQHSRFAHDADDALADACVQFLRYYDGPAGPDALHWMLLVTKRCAWAIGRGRVPESIDVADLPVPLTPAEIVERRDESSQVIRAIEALRPDQRTALILRGLGCSHDEIRRLRGWSLRKIHRCIADGRRRVRKKIEEGGDK